MTRWTDSDNLNGKEALVKGGPIDGMRLVVNQRGDRLLRLGGEYRYPDVVALDGYQFDAEAWAFVWMQD